MKSASCGLEEGEKGDRENEVRTLPFVEGPQLAILDLLQFVVLLPESFPLSFVSFDHPVQENVQPRPRPSARRQESMKSEEGEDGLGGLCAVVSDEVGEAGDELGGAASVEVRVRVLMS